MYRPLATPPGAALALAAAGLQRRAVSDGGDLPVEFLGRIP